MPTLTIQPCEFDEACSFVLKHHRHHPPPIRCKFQIAVNDGEKIVGVVMVGRPVARGNQDGWTLEVTRCCTDGTKNACSALYAAAWRAARGNGLQALDHLHHAIRTWHVIGGCWMESHWKNQSAKLGHA